MKTKLTALLLLLCLLCCAALGAQAATANAAIVAPKTAKIVAPFAGTLLPFDLANGDQVTAGDALFAFDTIPVYAPQGGKVAAVFAAEGDDASGVIARYGALAVIEPEVPLYISANTEYAYDDEENRYLHAGETLYIKHGDDEGEGRVTSVNGKDYVVEILSGDFELNDYVRCYREDDFPGDSETGRGRVKRYADTAITGAGRVARAHVQPGDTVQTGDLLFEMIDLSSAKGDDPVVSSPVSGAITLLPVLSGAQVYRGQLLCEIADLTALELSAEVDELDLAGLRVGHVLTYTLDAYADKTFSGTITEIRPIGSVRQNATYFDVRLTLPEEILLLPGMNGTVSIGE